MLAPHEWNKASHRSAGALDYDFLPVFHPAEKVGEPRLRFVLAHALHVDSVGRRVKVASSSHPHGPRPVPRRRVPSYRRRRPASTDSATSPFALPRSKAAGSKGAPAHNIMRLCSGSAGLAIALRKSA